MRPPPAEPTTLVPTSAIRLSDGQRLAWLRLIRAEGVGPATFRQLVNHFGSADGALAALPDLRRRGGAAGGRIPSVADAERELAALTRAGARLIALGEADYPPLLAHVDGPPPLLTVKGGGAILAAPAVAIVGARNASLAGIKIAARLAGDLAGAGFAVVSGLARGIDTAAHKASLVAGTVGVLAGGIDRPYPPENESLIGEIVASGGAVLTEMPFGWEARPHDFPRRNRLISGICLGVVLVEAARRSGSLHTARFALEQGREVLAVPGSPLDPRAEGTNDLIKRGATLVTGVDDVIAVLDPMRRRPGAEALNAWEPGGETAAPDDVPADARAAVLAALGPTPVGIDEVIRHTGLKPGEVALVLLELDLAGRLERHSRQLVSLIG